MEEVEILIDGLDRTSITSLLTKWNEVVNVRKKIEELEEDLRNTIKAYLKERNWDKYKDKETNIQITLFIEKREYIDKKHLKDMLSDAQYAQISRISSFEKMQIITPEMRKRLSKIVRKKKGI